MLFIVSINTEVRIEPRRHDVRVTVQCQCMSYRFLRDFKVINMKFIFLNSFIALDANGGVSAKLQVIISMCDGCSGHGTCDFASYTLLGNGSNYRFADCNCDVGWTGSNQADQQILIELWIRIQYGTHALRNETRLFVPLTLYHETLYHEWSNSFPTNVFLFHYVHDHFLTILLAPRCSQDVDGCASQPCGANNTAACTDKTPDQQKQEHISYTCSSCLPGYYSNQCVGK